MTTERITYAAIQQDLPEVLNEITALDLLNKGYMPQAVAFALMVSSAKACASAEGQIQNFRDMVDAAWSIGQKELKG